MSKYERAPEYHQIATGVSRLFEISGGLVEGYETGVTHDIREVVELHHLWQRRNETIQGVRIIPATISYGWPTENDGIHGASEPGFILSGGINVLYDHDLGGGEAEERIMSLATFLARRLNQTRIYVTFLGRDYILEYQPQDA